MTAEAPGRRLGQSLLDQLGGVGPIRTPVGLVVAHPDDETIAMAGVLTRFVQLTLIHLTDGAPRDPASWVGQPTQAQAAAVRRAELSAALSAAAARPVARLALGLTDGAVLEAAGGLVAQLMAALAQVEVVITHAYEGGHIDHDVCALSVQAACQRLRSATGRAPDRVEFGGYRGVRGQLRAGTFWPHPQHPPVTLTLSEAALQRRRSAFACHRSQEGNLRYFSLIQESFRTAPRYDPSSPPPGGMLYAASDGERLRAVMAAI